MTSYGTIGNPFTFYQAMNTGYIKPGHTLYLRGGTYSGEWTSQISGTAGNPITIKPYPGETVIIDCTDLFTLNGGYTTWRDGIIFTHAGWTSRQSAYNSLNPPDLPANARFQIRGPGTKIINCIFHDLSECELWEPAPDTEIYGCVFYNNGFRQANGVGVGHCLYTQNDTGTMLIHNNVFVSAYNFGFHAYGSNVAYLNNYDVRRNIHMSTRFLIGGGAAVVPAGIVVDANAFYGSPVQLGYVETIADDVTISNNYIAGARLQVGRHQRVSVSGNTVAHIGDVLVYVPPPSPPSGTWDGNAYHGTGTPFTVDGVGFKSFAQWQSYSGWDEASTYSASQPSANVIKVYPNSYGGAHRGSVAIYNWEGLVTVNVDLSSLGLTIGQAYKLRNAQNYFAEWQAFTYTGSPVAVTMTGWTVAVPIAAAAALYPSTFPTFGAFVVTP